jgi:chemotaxis protein CheX
MATDLLEAPPAVDSFTDPLLTKAVSQSLSKAFVMCGLKARMVGLSRVPANEHGLITGMIGVHGKVSGFVTVNLSETMAVKAVEGLIQDKFGKLTPQVVDGTGEITNLVAGGVKSQLAGSNWAFAQITVPSVIVGKGYQIAYARSLEFLAVTFEVEDSSILMLEDRLVHVSLSLLRL